MSYRPTKLPVREDRGLNYSNGYQAEVNTCVQCGALVMDFTTHDRWHSDQRDEEVSGER